MVNVRFIKGLANNPRQVEVIMYCQYANYRQSSELTLVCERSADIHGCPVMSKDDLIGNGRCAYSDVLWDYEADEIIDGIKKFAILNCQNDDSFKSYLSKLVLKRQINKFELEVYEVKPNV
jgi:hypothetical protein